MPELTRASILTHFEALTDPRDPNLIEHKLIDIVTIALCAVIAGADGWVAVEEFGRAKQGWLETFLELPHGIPSHDTFGRVFAALDPDEFAACFLSWVRSVAEVAAGEVVAVDGKQLRCSHDRALGKDAITMVSAWATELGVALGQVKVAEGSNEITAIPRLLQVLMLKGCIVTLDALGCQTEVVATLVEQGADYAIMLKANQGNLHEDVTDLFAYAHETGFAGMTHDYARTVNKGHGRIEVRECWTLSDLEAFPHLHKLSTWPGLQTVAMVRYESRVGVQTHEEVRYCISSLPPDAARLLRTVRQHWRIENGLHWVLDIAFREDDARVRQDNAAENFAVLRRIALNLLKQDKSAQCGVKTRRLKAGWDETYLLKVLLGCAPATPSAGPRRGVCH